MVFQRRLVRLFLLACLALTVIWLRVIQLQVVEGDMWRSEAVRKRQRVVELAAPRGRIVDASGRVLARDVPKFQLALVGLEWQRRGRIRCTACGTIHFHKADRSSRLRACPCRDPDSRLEAQPLPDVSELEELLEQKPGELARRAEDRIARVEELVAAKKRALEAEDQLEFLVHDEVQQYRVDLLLRPYVIVRHMREEAVRLVELDESGRYRGFKVRTDLRREYADDGPSGQLLGFVSVVEDAEELEELRTRYGRNVTLDTRVGRAGLEKGLDALLLGRTGWVRQARDDSGDFTVVVDEERPARGREIRLALTTEACREAERVLLHWGGKDGYYPQSRPSGGFVALRADTGAVVAWGEMPRLVLSSDLRRLFEEADAVAEFDPTVGQYTLPEGHVPPHGETLDEWRARISKPAPLHLSRVSQIAVEPGSTFKAFIGLGLLEGLHHLPEGTPLPYGLPFICLGRDIFPGCHAHAAVFFEGALATSCNRYFALSLRDHPRYWPVYQRTVPALLLRIGFGRPTGVDVAGETDGIFLRDWADFDLSATVHRTILAIRRERGVDPGRLQLRMGTRLPARVAGRDPQRLSDLLARVAGAALDVAPSGRVVLSVEEVGREERYHKVRFEVYAQPGPNAPAPEPLDHTRLERAVANLGGALEASVKSGGVITLGFTLTYHEAIGRSPGEPPLILKDDGRNFAIGQGPITTTPLQVARAMAVLANGGRLVTPHVAVAADDARLSEEPPFLGLDPADIERVRRGMRGVVAPGEGGTARLAAWHEVPATVYGKTGTSQAGTWWSRRVPADEREGPWHHWFAGFAEAPGQPPLVFACVLHSRTEKAASYTVVNAVQAFLAWWYRAGPGAR